MIVSNKLSLMSLVAHYCLISVCVALRDSSIATPPGWDASPSQVTPSIPSGFSDSLLVPILYSWVERGTVRVKCLAQEHNTMTPPRART